MRMREDLTFTSRNTLFIFGRVWSVARGRYLWQVRCHCGKVRSAMTTGAINKYKPFKGCKCPSKYRVEGSVAYVDCSTPTYPDRVCILDIEVFNEKYKGRKLSCYRSGYSDLLYVACQGSAVHREVNNTPKDLNTDHISGNTLDNRKVNLRSATKKENGQNCRINKDNTSGFSGVSYRKDTRKWVAKITVDSKVLWLGTTFTTLEEAVTARKEAEVLHGFHENHGRK